VLLVTLFVKRYSLKYKGCGGVKGALGACTCFITLLYVQVFKKEERKEMWVK
jgi:hypothetical protein